MERRLAAILAADVVGYSRLIEADEVGTLAALKARRRDVLAPLVAKHQGRVFKVTGDGVLVEFGSAVEAVQCAVEVQERFEAANAGLSEDRRIVLRIGVNLGDVTVEGGDLYGDGVNVAARLEALAEPGGIVLSADVQRQVRGKMPLDVQDLGLQRLKNIASPVQVYRLQTGRPGAPSSGLQLPDKPSIAVLPFQNMSGDPEQDYFADGMVEEIVTALSRLRWLFVIARNSSFAFKGQGIDVKQVGRELGVRYVLEGSVRKAGNRVRITGQLVDASTGAHLWADRFDGELADVFDLQDRVTASVVGAIAPKLEQAEIDRSRRKPTESLDAYDYYLRGLASLHNWTRAGTDEALSHFLRAVELDPEYSSAYAMAAGCHLWRKGNGWAVDRAAEAATAERLARRAIALGKDNPIALCWGGITLAYLAGAAVEGGAYIDQALALDPNYAAAWGFSCWARIWLGRMEEAIEHAERAMRLSPLDPLAYNRCSAMAFAQFMLGRYDGACAWAEQAIREAPTYASAHRTFAASSAMAGRMDDARWAADRLRQLDPNFHLSDASYYWPFRRQQDLDKFVDGLRRAGLPE